MHCPTSLCRAVLVVRHGDSEPGVVEGAMRSVAWQYQVGMSVRVPVAGKVVDGSLALPDDARAAVVIVYGAGWSRGSARTLELAELLHAADIATFATDLLDEREREAALRGYPPGHDLDDVANRILAVTDWLVGDSSRGGLHVGYFAGGISAPAAMIAAAQRPSRVAAVVCCGGPIEMATSIAQQLWAPTMFIVTSADAELLERARGVFGLLQADSDLQILNREDELDGSGDRILRLAHHWFGRWLPSHHGSPDEPGR